MRPRHLFGITISFSTSPQVTSSHYISQNHNQTQPWTLQTLDMEVIHRTRSRTPHIPTTLLIDPAITHHKPWLLPAHRHPHHHHSLTQHHHQHTSAPVSPHTPVQRHRHGPPLYPQVHHLHTIRPVRQRYTLHSHHHRQSPHLRLSIRLQRLGRTRKAAVLALV